MEGMRLRRSSTANKFFQTFAALERSLWPLYLALLAVALFLLPFFRANQECCGGQRSGVLPIARHADTIYERGPLLELSCSVVSWNRRRLFAPQQCSLSSSDEQALRDAMREAIHLQNYTSGRGVVVVLSTRDFPWATLQRVLAIANEEGFDRPQFAVSMPSDPMLSANSPR